MGALHVLSVTAGKCWRQAGRSLRRLRPRKSSAAAARLETPSLRTTAAMCTRTALRRNDEPLGDLGGRPSLRQQLEYFPLTARQPLGMVCTGRLPPARLPLTEALEKTGDQSAMHGCLAAADAAERIRKPAKVHRLQQVSVHPDRRAAKRSVSSSETVSTTIFICGSRALISQMVARPPPGIRRSTRQMSGFWSSAASGIASAAFAASAQTSKARIPGERPANVVACRWMVVRDQGAE